VQRLHRAAWLALALLCAFTLAAGATAASILPARLALWKLPTVARIPAAGAGAATLLPAPGLGGHGGGRSGLPARARPATPAGVAAALGRVLSTGVLGTRYGVLVTDLSTGRVLLAQAASAGFEPASTTKLATAVAALDVLGPAARLTTRVVERSGGSTPEIVLVGGGDPTLAAGRPPAADYPQPATLLRLAAATAAALRRQHVARVRLGYDVSLFRGPGLAPGWPASYVTTGNVTPIAALEVDQGRLTASGAPQDADDPANYRPRTFTPVAEAVSSFAGFLAADHIAVSGPARAVRTPYRRLRADRAGTLASVESPPLALIVQWMLTESNNVIAENLARQVAIATGHPATFSGAAAAVTSVVRRLGVTGLISLADGSGLSPDDRISPQALVQLVTLAAGARHPALRPTITGLPVAGFTGTLAPQGSVFGVPGGAALGVVRAKTGNLSNVAALAGLAYTRGGQLLAFAFMADGLRPAHLVAAAHGMSRLAEALAGCGCYRP